jgi:HK97 gp10 family phage protein
MARGPSARVVLNRSKFPAVFVAVADGLFEVAKTIIEEADPPDATPFGEGLVTRGGALAYVGDKKVAGWGTDGKQPKKPRAFKVRGSGRIMAIAGFGFPARFQEFGTIKQPARPFLTPAMNRVIPRITEIMKPVVEAELRKIP